jgi:hypothetical protein
VVLAQWVRAGLAMVRGAMMSGRGLVGGAIALWRLAQAVRLAILLARRLADAAGVASPITDAVASEAGLGFPSALPGALDAPSANAAALSRALAEIATAISAAVDRAPRPRAAAVATEGAASLPEPPRPGLGWTPPHIWRADRPPGPARPRRRRSRPARALQTIPPPIAALAIGRSALARA